jgi:hypothetical protein
MKRTLRTEEMVSELVRDPYARWTHEGARAIIEYLEDLEEQTGEELEFDLVAIRSQWTEYATLEEAAAAIIPDYANWAKDYDEDELMRQIRQELADSGTILHFAGGFVIG